MKTLKERFEDKVFYSPDGCWYWIGDMSGGSAYGAITIGGKRCRAHRVSYMIYNGDITDDLHVMHSCDNPLCVNPDHLSLGTHLQNRADSAVKGRSGNNNKKLSIEQVREIKLRLSMGESNSSVGRLYGIHESSVRRIRHGLSFRYV